MDESCGQDKESFAPSDCCVYRESNTTYLACGRIWWLMAKTETKAFWATKQVTIHHASSK